MSHGIQVRDSSGNIILDTNYYIGRVRYYHITADSGESGSVVLPDISSSTVVAFGIIVEIPEGGTYLSPHLVTISGTTVSWEPPVWGWMARSLILVIWK